jgi:hypothetical protein
LLVASISACHRDPGIVPANDDIVGRASSADRAGGNNHDDDDKKQNTPGVSSPYVVGAWKFIADPNHPNEPKADTEFRFINPTNIDATLEYAFFDLAGNFCGCDRDDFPPDHTTVYTMLGESLTMSPTNMPVFTCPGTSGALKSIAFTNKGKKIILGDAMQVGFQTSAFFDVEETPLPDPNNNVFPNFITGKRMTEAGLQGVGLNDATRDEIQNIHQQCVTVNGEL